jgi:hypothetical protein
LGKSLGRNLHWQPVRNRYSTAQNTSYWSTVVGLVRQRTLLQQRTDFFKLLLTHVAGVSVSHPTIFGTTGKIVNTFLVAAIGKGGSSADMAYETCQAGNRKKHITGWVDGGISDLPVVPMECRSSTLVLHRNSQPVGTHIAPVFPRLPLSPVGADG